MKKDPRPGTPSTTTMPITRRTSSFTPLEIEDTTVTTTTSSSNRRNTTRTTTTISSRNNSYDSDNDDDDNEALLLLMSDNDTDDDHSSVFHFRSGTQFFGSGFVPFKIMGALTILILLLGVLLSSSTSSNSNNKINNMYCKQLAQQSHSDWIQFMEQQVMIEETPRQQQQQNHWCTITTNCTCHNPGKGWIPREEVEGAWGKRWKHGFARNVQLVQNVTHASSSSQPRLVFYGDSITEHWLATSLGDPRPNYEENRKVYQELFEGWALPLGLSGDRTPQLIYRLQNGELPDALQPSYFWVLIGINDHLGDNCSWEAISAGIITIAEYLLTQRPQAHVILNAVLPYGYPDLLEPEEFAQHRAQIYCYTQAHPRLHFFNATDIFIRTTADGTNQQDVLNVDYMPDYLHPNGAGSLVWGKAIVEFLDKLETDD